MNIEKEIFAFRQIPQEFNLLREKIADEYIKKLYSNFNFKYLNCENQQNGIETFLFDFLNKFHFITLEISMITPINENESLQLCNVVICVEETCLFIELIDLKVLQNIQNQIGAAWVDIKKDKEVTEEISSFCKHFISEIKNNQFVRFTIKAIIAFMIRRFFYPSNYFKNQAFFYFNQKPKTNQKIDFSTFNPMDIINILKNDKQEYNEIRQISYFEESQFIVLRNIYNNQFSKFFLVIDLKSFHIFMLKKIILYNAKPIEHEIDFCKNFYHRCLTPFYGFVMTKEQKISGFVYKYMTNGTLLQFMLDKRENVDEYFSYMTMIRIVLGINYLHSKSLIHRDIKALNIMVDNDNIPYISDFDTIRKIDDDDDEITQDIGSYKYVSPEQFQGIYCSFSTDIYSFGQLMFFIFEKKDIFDPEFINSSNIKRIHKNEIPETNYIQKSIKNIIEKCIEDDPNKRPTIEEIKNSIYREVSSFYFLETSFLKDFFANFEKLEVQQYFIEMYYFLFLFENHKELFNDHTIHFIELLCLVKSNRTELIQNIFVLGMFYYEGTFGEVNYNKAIEIFEFCAEQKNSNSLNTLGNIYKNGQGVEIDYVKAKEYYELSAELGNLHSFTNLGSLYIYGLGVERDFFKGKKYLEIAAQEKDPTALCNLGLLYSINESSIIDYQKAKHFFELAAQYNHPVALHQLGFLYLSGNGIEKDYKKAKYYFELAAYQYNIESFHNLGLIYERGLGVEVDYQKAKNYFEFAAKHNNSCSLNSLGSLYLKGNGVEKDYKKAMYYFDLSAKQNNSLALYNLGVIYKNGIGTPKDYPRSKHYFELSAKQNNSEAIFALAIFYYLGQGVEKDYKKAKELLEISAENNNIRAFFYLGLMYKNGKDVEKDYSKAKYYFELAMKNNFPDAYYEIAKLYYKGHGINKDYSKAIIYFNLAFKFNYLDSLFYLGSIYEKGEGIEIDISKAICYFTLSSSIKKKAFSLELSQYAFIDDHDIENHFYYRSNNNLGLIYITEKRFQNIELAEKYIKEAGLNEYPFGQNNYGLLNQYYLNNTEKAKYMYERASKHHFALSEFNLAQISEKEESIIHYLNASEYENEQLTFHKHIIKDERLEVSKSFIICYTNLILTRYYYSTEKNKSIKFFLNSLFRPLFRLLFGLQNNSYSFSFLTQKSGTKSIFLNLKDFIINNPLYKLSEIQNNSQFGWQKNEKNLNEIELFISENEIKENLIHSKKNRQVYNLKEINDNINSYFNYQFMNDFESIFNFMNIQNKFELINIQSYKDFEIYSIKSKQNNSECLLKFPKNLGEIILNTFNDLIINVDEIIDEMKKILFKPPYSIFFGRIKIFALHGIKANIDEIPEINQLFYEGFDIKLN